MDTGDLQFLKSKFNLWKQTGLGSTLTQPLTDMSSAYEYHTWIPRHAILLRPWCVSQTRYVESSRRRIWSRGTWYNFAAVSDWFVYLLQIYLCQCSEHKHVTALEILEIAYMYCRWRLRHWDTQTSRLQQRDTQRWFFRNDAASKSWDGVENT